MKSSWRNISISSGGIERRIKREFTVEQIAAKYLDRVGKQIAWRSVRMEDPPLSSLSG